MPSAPDYLAYQLVVRSSLPIPGAIALAPLDPGRARHVDIEISEGPVVADAAARRAGPYHLFDKQVIFEARGVGRYRCTRGAITIARVDGADDAILAGFLVATALPICLWLRGEFVLHAAAAWLPNAAGAVAIAGRSGSGKSTVLRELVGLGARMVADDSLCLRRSAAGLEASGLAAGYFLGAAPRPFHELRRDQQVPAAPLAGLVILETPRSHSPVGIRPLHGVSALEALLNHRHRARVPELLGIAASQLGMLSAVAARLPIHLWQRREGAIALAPSELDFLAGLSGAGALQ